MDYIYSLGLSDDTIKQMMEVNPELKDFTDTEVKEKIEILNVIGCSPRSIRNIVSSNPMYFSKSNDSIKSLVSFLNMIGINMLNILFDANPYILDLEVFEIKDYINKRIRNRETLEEIVDDLESNPYLFSDM